MATLLVLPLLLGISGCGSAGGPASLSKAQAVPLAEISPPEGIQVLKRTLDSYRPQVKIVSPQPDEVLTSNRVAVRFRVEDLPLFKDPVFELGPHLHVFLDDQPYRAVYDVNQPVVFENLTPGTHTIRAFASRPWHESFKDRGAFAQVSFHVFTPTHEHQVDTQQPLLTYSRPQGSYGAEPVMLDYYLSNVLLPPENATNSQNSLPNWRLRVTVNGRSFEVREWQPIYLTGLQEGQNWVKLELLDEQGQLIPNAFNEQVRVFDVQPGGQDALSRLVRGELTAVQAQRIVDPNYKEPEVEEISPPPSSPLPETLAPEQDRQETGLEPRPFSVEVSPSLRPEGASPPPLVPLPVEEHQQSQGQEPELEVSEEESQPAATAIPAPTRRQGWFSRFRSAPEPQPLPSDALPELPEGSVPEAPSASEAWPQVPESDLVPDLETPGDSADAEEAIGTGAIAPPSEPSEVVPPRPQKSAKPFRNRFRRAESEQRPPTPAPVETLPEASTPVPLPPQSSEVLEALPAQEPEVPGSLDADGSGAAESRTKAASPPWQGLLQRFQRQSEPEPSADREEEPAVEMPQPAAAQPPLPPAVQPSGAEPDAIAPPVPSLALPGRDAPAPPSAKGWGRLWQRPAQPAPESMPSENAAELLPEEKLPVPDSRPSEPEQVAPDANTAQPSLNLDDLLQTQKIDIDNPPLVTPGAPPPLPNRYRQKSQGPGAASPLASDYSIPASTETEAELGN